MDVDELFESSMAGVEDFKVVEENGRIIPSHDLQTFSFHSKAA